MKQFLDSKYYVTEDGKIWSEHTSKFLKQCKNNKGYLTVCVKHKGKTYGFAHIITAIAYHGFREGMEVDHINNIRDDNHKDNLTWLSRKDNVDKSLINNTPIRNFIGCQLLHKGKVIGEFKSKVDACRFFETEIGGKFSVMRRFEKSGDYEIKKV